MGRKHVKFDESDLLPIFLGGRIGSCLPGLGSRVGVILSWWIQLSFSLDVCGGRSVHLSPS